MKYTADEGEVDGHLSVTLCAEDGDDDEAVPTPFDTEFYGMDDEIEGRNKI